MHLILIKVQPRLCTRHPAALSTPPSFPACQRSPLLLERAGLGILNPLRTLSDSDNFNRSYIPADQFSMSKGCRTSNVPNLSAQDVQIQTDGPPVPSKVATGVFYFKLGAVPDKNSGTSFLRPNPLIPLRESSVQDNSFPRRVRIEGSSRDLVKRFD